MDKYTVAEIAFKNGYEAGQKEFADKLASIILKKKNSAETSRETYCDGPGDEGGFAYWLGRGTTYAEVLTLILELREGITAED